MLYQWNRVFQHPTLSLDDLNKCNPFRGIIDMLLNMQTKICAEYGVMYQEPVEVSCRVPYKPAGKLAESQMVLTGIL